MVISKIKKVFVKEDERIEVLVHKLSKTKLELKNLKKSHFDEIQKVKEELNEKMARELIEIYENIWITKEESFKIRSTNKDIQNMFIYLNNAEKKINSLLKNYFVEIIIPKERKFDPELHEIASYEKVKGVEKGIILKTIRKGFKYKNKYIKKPRVLVSS